MNCSCDLSKNLLEYKVRRCSSVVEQCFRKAWVVGSSPAIGSMDSRLRKKKEKQAILNIILIVFGMIILFGALIIFGIPILINFSLTMEKFNKSNQSSNSTNNLSYIAPPNLNPMTSATNSASISVSGFGTPKTSVNLFVNNKLADKTTVKDDRSFNFDNIILNDGQNSIKAKTMSGDNQESDYSDPIIISFINKPPSLSIDSPQDGQTVKDDTMIVKGTIDPGDKVTINDFWAIADDQGKFSYTLKLQNGDNAIKFAVTDQAGNKTEKVLKVTYSP